MTPDELIRELREYVGPLTAMQLTARAAYTIASMQDEIASMQEKIERMQDDIARMSEDA